MNLISETERILCLLLVMTQMNLYKKTCHDNSPVRSETYIIVDFILLCTPLLKTLPVKVGCP